MLTTEQNERLTRVGLGTPCGELMRRYWHPVAASSQLAAPGTKPVRILGENLVLFRDREGGLGLVEPHCPHRKAGLLYGMPEQSGLRCTYHGWLFNADGQCTEQPFETYVNPDSRYKDEIKVKAYPVEELGGLIFAYLGPEPRPLLPRWEPFVLDGVYREIGMALIPCNWLQTVENAGDTSHVVTTHWQFSQYVLEKLGRLDLSRHDRTSGAAGYLVKREEPVGPYGIGAVLFPYTDAQGDMTYQLRVPVDDTHTLHIWYMAHTPEAQAELGVELPVQNDQREIPVFYVPVPAFAHGVEPEWPLLDSNCGQDLLMWCTQGPIMDRTDEHLGVGDKHIVQFRKLLEQQVAIVESGGDPINTFRDPSENVCLVPPYTVRMRPRVAADGRPDRTNAVRKYSPVYTKATIMRLGDDALSDPVH